GVPDAAPRALHDALPIGRRDPGDEPARARPTQGLEHPQPGGHRTRARLTRAENQLSEGGGSITSTATRWEPRVRSYSEIPGRGRDRKSTRLNSSHQLSSY